MKEMMNGGRTGGEKAMEKEESKDEVLKNLILGLSPKALAEKFKQEEAEGNLEQFIAFLVNDDALLAGVSWWEKWLTNSQVKLFEAAIKDRKLRDAEKLKTDILPLGLEKKFSPEELRAIFSNIGAVQLTYGCSMACKFCAFDALPGAREHIPFEQVKSLLEQFGSIFSKGNRRTPETFFYYASDPWDYRSEDKGEEKDFKDVYTLAKQFTGVASGIRTRKITDKDWIDTLENINSNEGIRSTATISSLGVSNESFRIVQEAIRGKTIKIEGGETNIRGIGKDSLESKDSLGKGGIGCFDGTVLTPRGVYTTVQLPISEQFPQGMIIVPFERFDISQIKKGIRLDEALRFVIPINREIKEKNTDGARLVDYKSGLTEFEVLTERGNIYLRVDENFMVLGMDSAGIESRIKEYFKKIEIEIQQIENFEYSKEDMDFMLLKYLGKGYPSLLPCPPGRRREDFPVGEEDRFKYSRYWHDSEQIKVVMRVTDACSRYQKDTTRSSP